MRIIKNTTALISFPAEAVIQGLPHQAEANFGYFLRGFSLSSCFRAL
jgi:hypothetical protein